MAANVQRMEETGAIKLNHENGGGIMKGGRVAAGKVVKPASGSVLDVHKSET